MHESKQWVTRLENIWGWFVSWVVLREVWATEMEGQAGCWHKAGLEMEMV